MVKVFRFKTVRWIGIEKLWNNKLVKDVIAASYSPKQNKFQEPKNRNMWYIFDQKYQLEKVVFNYKRIIFWRISYICMKKMPSHLVGVTFFMLFEKRAYHLKCFLFLINPQEMQNLILQVLSTSATSLKQGIFWKKEKITSMRRIVSYPWKI